MKQREQGRWPSQRDLLRLHWMHVWSSRGPPAFVTGATHKACPPPPPTAAPGPAAVAPAALLPAARRVCGGAGGCILLWRLSTVLAAASFYAKTRACRVWGCFGSIEVSVSSQQRSASRLRQRFQQISGPASVLLPIPVRGGSALVPAGVARVFANHRRHGGVGGGEAPTERPSRLLCSSSPQNCDGLATGGPPALPRNAPNRPRAWGFNRVYQQGCGPSGRKARQVAWMTY